MRSLLLIALLPGIAAAQPADVEALATNFVERLVKNEFAAAIELFNDKMRAALPEDKLRATWSAVVAQAGAYRRSDPPQVTPKGDYRIVVVPTEFENGKIDIQIAFDGAGRIGGLFMRPSAAAAATAFTDASYVDPARFTEREVTIDAGGWPLPGTLTLPVGVKAAPAIVLVHGSGPNDRDETVGPNKPFRDLARGLGSRGIAVLRYVKRTRQHGAKLAQLKTFTAKDEVVDDAVAAVQLLSTLPEIDSKRVFVAGHSFGGMLAPRIAAAAEGRVRGLIVLAGAARSLPEMMLEQVRYLAQSDGTISDQEREQIAGVEAFAARVAGMKADDPPAAVGGIGAPASYWIDLRNWDPLAAAQSLKLPMLFLQGERDFQVTMAGDLARWRKALAGRDNVTFKTYPALNHLFIAGTGPSYPQEYQTAGHVDETVIADIAAWIQKH